MLIIFIGPIISFLTWILNVIMKVIMFFEDVFDAICNPFRKAKRKQTQKEAERREKERLKNKMNLEQNILSANRDGKHEDAVRLFREARETGFSDKKQEALCYLRAADSLSFIAADGREFDLATRYAIRGGQINPELDEEAKKLCETIRERGSEQLAPLYHHFSVGIDHRLNCRPEEALTALQTAARQGYGSAAELTVHSMLNLAKTLDDCRKIEPWVELCRDLECDSIDKLTISLKRSTLYFEAEQYFNQGDDNKAIAKCREGINLGNQECALLAYYVYRKKYDDISHYKVVYQLLEQARKIEPGDLRLLRAQNWVRGKLTRPEN